MIDATLLWYHNFNSGDTVMMNEQAETVFSQTLALCEKHTALTFLQWSGKTIQGCAAKKV